MRALLLAALVAAAPAASAQMVKCTDAKGRTIYTDQALGGCAGKTAQKAPAAAASAPPPRRAAPPAKSAAPRKSAAPATARAPEVRFKNPKQQESYCRGLKQEEAWLSRSAVENREARLGQARQALQACP